MTRIGWAAALFVAMCAMTAGVVAEPPLTATGPVAAATAPSITVYKSAD